MKSTGEVMGIAEDFPAAFGKAQAGAGVELPREGSVFISVCDTDKPAATQLAARMHDLGLPGARDRGDGRRDPRDGHPGRAAEEDRRGIAATSRTAIRSGDVDIVINTPAGRGARADGWEIRRAAIERNIPCITTMTGASAAARAIGVEGRDRRALAAGAARAAPSRPRWPTRRRSPS